MIPAIISLALQAAPLIGKWIGGSKAEETLKEVTGIAENLFGTNDPQAILKKIAEDRELYVQWQTRLAELGAEKDEREHLERLEEFRDIANARDNYGNSKNITDALAKTTVVSFFLLNGIVIGTIFYMMLEGAPAIMTKNVELTLAAWGVINMILGWVNAKTDVVYNFFLGSSRGSDTKNEALANTMNKLAKAVSK